MISPKISADIAHAVAANVRSLRISRGISQEELAERLHVAFHTVNRLENARRLPRADLLFLLADFFGVSADRLRATPAA